MSDETMKELGALFELAGETQRAATEAVDSLSRGANEIGKSVEVLKRSSADLPKSVEASAKRGIEDAIRSAREEVVSLPKAATAAVAKEFEHTVKQAAHQIRNAVSQSEDAATWTTWAAGAAILFLGIAIGAVGAIYLRPPKAPTPAIYVDSDEIASKVVAALRHRR
jgi:formiminotetrahydrofolate cyclodeaminase